MCFKMVAVLACKQPHELQGTLDWYMISSHGNIEGNPGVVAIPTVGAGVHVKVWPVRQPAGQDVPQPKSRKAPNSATVGAYSRPFHSK